jgi:RecJ-like exonuclease
LAYFYSLKAKADAGEPAARVMIHGRNRTKNTYRRQMRAKARKGDLVAQARVDRYRANSLAWQRELKAKVDAGDLEARKLYKRIIDRSAEYKRKVQSAARAGDQTALAKVGKWKATAAGKKLMKNVNQVKRHQIIKAQVQQDDWMDGVEERWRRGQLG